MIMRVFESSHSLVLANRGRATSWLCSARGSYLISVCLGFHICIMGFTKIPVFFVIGKTKSQMTKVIGKTKSQNAQRAFSRVSAQEMIAMAW